MKKVFINKLVLDLNPRQVFGSELVNRYSQLRHKTNILK